MADLKGRDVIIPASTWPDMTPPLAAGWPGKVTEYMTGGSTSRGGRERRWGVMADVDIADPQHKGQGSREFNRNCTSLLTLAQLRNCIVLLSGEAIDDISGDKRGRRSAAAVQNARPQAGTAASHGESAAATHELGHSPGPAGLQIPRALPVERSARRETLVSDKLGRLRVRENVFELEVGLPPCQGLGVGKKTRAAVEGKRGRWQALCGYIG